MTAEQKAHRQIPRIYLMFASAFLASMGYGATFVLNRHYASFGGNEVDTGTILAAAMLGTFASLPIIDWKAARFGAARLGAAGSALLSLGFAAIALTHSVSTLGILGGVAIGAGWGAFYLAAPLALSQLVSNNDRAYWFTRFAAFQMAGIGISPFVGELMLDWYGISTGTYFALVALACGIAAVLLYYFSFGLVPSGADASRASWLTAGPAILASRARFPIIMVALGACTFGGAMTYQSSLVAGTGLSASTYFLVYSITVVAARWTLARWIAGFPAERSVPVLLILMVAGLACLFGLQLGLTCQVLSAALFGIGYGLVYPLIQALAVNDVDNPEHRNAVLTWFVLSYFVGIFGFPLLGGWLIATLGTGMFIALLTTIGGLELLTAWRRNNTLQPK